MEYALTTKRRIAGYSGSVNRSGPAGQGRATVGHSIRDRNRKEIGMINIYDLEKRMIERKREIDEALLHDALVRQLEDDTSNPRRAARPPVRARFGLLLIRLGSRLAA